MAKEPTPRDPKLAAIVEKLEKDFYALEKREDLQKPIADINKDWTDLKKYFSYIWFINP